MDNSNLDNLRTALSSNDFSKNFFAGFAYEHSLQVLQQQLESRSPKLFSERSEAVVRVLELPSRYEEGYYEKRFGVGETSDFDVKERFGERERSDVDVEERFEVFITAALRKRCYDPARKFIQVNPGLEASVMPSFIMYILPFGQQHYPRDDYSIGFRSDSCFDIPNTRLKIPALDRSGRHLELCYTLRAAELSVSEPNSWSIRQCSVYHRFDLETGKATWIVVKANDLIKKEIMRQSYAEDFEFRRKWPLSATLETHRIIATWAGENWYWYLNHLAEVVQDRTMRLLTMSTDANVPKKEIFRSPTLQSDASPRRGFRRISTLHSVSHVFERVYSRLSGSTLRKPHDLESQGTRSDPLDTQHSVVVDEIAFEDLQDVQILEDMVNVALMVLKANTGVISDLRREYQSLKKSPNCPGSPFRDSQTDLARFDQHLFNIERDLGMQYEGAKALLRLLTDRKTMMQSIIHHRNMEATKLLAVQAQESTVNMEKMTKDMHVLARKTKGETVSMRIITLVTLFFLPSTFISTLMSTPLVHFDSTKSGFSWRNIGLGALELYLVASVPLVGLTFLAWWITYRQERQRATLEENAEDTIKDKPA